jgi:hypothetical protein
MAEKVSLEGLKSAADAAKQIITLCTGLIAITVTFLEKIVAPVSAGARDVPWPMFAAWVLFGLAIIAGVMTLLGITGTLDAIDRQQNGLPLNEHQKAAIAGQAYGQNIVRWSMSMVVLFLAGVGFTIATGIMLAR